MKKRLKRIENKLNWQNKALAFLLEENGSEQAKEIGGQLPPGKKKKND